MTIKRPFRGLGSILRAPEPFEIPSVHPVPAQAYSVQLVLSCHIAFFPNLMGGTGAYGLRPSAVPIAVRMPIEPDHYPCHQAHTSEGEEAEWIRARAPIMDENAKGEGDGQRRDDEPPKEPSSSRAHRPDLRMGGYQPFHMPGLRPHRATRPDRILEERLCLRAMGPGQ